MRKPVKAAWIKAGIVEAGNGHMFRGSFATQLLERGSYIRTVQELLGHRDVQTTMMYAYAFIWA